MQPTPTKTARNIQRDGRLVIALTKPFCKFNLSNRYEFRPDRPTIICANHRSLLDVFIAAACCAAANVSCRFLVNARYFSNPLVGRWLRRIGCIPLSSETRDEAFAEASASLERGEVIGIMPEGRLVAAKDRVNGQVGACRPGAAALAAQAGARLRPIAFHNAERVWPRGKWPIPRFFRRPVVTVVLSDVHVEPSQDHQQDTDKIMGELTSILNELDEAERNGEKSRLVVSN